MNGGGRRQLPSWMQKSCTVEQVSISEAKQEIKEIDSRVLKQCRGPNSIKQKSEATQVGNESPLPVQRRISKRKRVSNKHGEDEDDSLLCSNVEDEAGSVRKKRLNNAQGKTREKKVSEIMEDSHNALLPGDDDLTVEDLVSIAEEYVNAHEEKELKRSQKLQKSETGPLYKVNSEFRSEKGPTVHEEDNNSQNFKPIPSTSSLTDPLPIKQSIICPSNNGDHAQDMLNLFFGDLLRKTEEKERSNISMTEDMLLDHGLSKSIQTDILVDKVPEMKKKTSLKEKVAMFLG